MKNIQREKKNKNILAPTSLLCVFHHLLQCGPKLSKTLLFLLSGNLPKSSKSDVSGCACACSWASRSVGPEEWRLQASGCECRDPAVSLLGP